MRRFEARFFPSHPRKRDYIVVGHVICERECATDAHRIVPSPSLRDANAPAAILATLRHLVRVARRESFDDLASASGRSWSFVEVPATSAEDAR